MSLLSSGSPSSSPREGRADGSDRHLLLGIFAGTLQRLQLRHVHEALGVDGGLRIRTAIGEDRRLKDAGERAGGIDRAVEER